LDDHLRVNLKEIENMRLLTCIGLFLTFLTGCSNKTKERINYWSEFKKENHLKPELDKIQFDTLSNWDLGWFLLEPINIIKDQEEDEISVTKRYSSGQKALHFFWYLDGQVTNGGFIQFYLNGYGKYIPAIIEGLTFIDDKEMLDLVKKADELYVKHQKQIDKQSGKGDWGNLYNDLTDFNQFDKKYFKIHDKTMAIIETYARQHIEEFGMLK
jgi:Domain of unknown function (DUF4375)